MIHVSVNCHSFAPDLFYFHVVVYIWHIFSMPLNPLFSLRHGSKQGKMFGVNSVGTGSLLNYECAILT